MNNKKPILKQQNKSKKRVYGKIVFIVFLSLLLNQMVFPQTIEINGKVTDEEGIPLIGATVLIKGSTTGVITDIDGKFNIEASLGDVLVFSYVGYLTQEIKIQEGITTVDIELKSDVLGLEEVVVVGYGVQRKEDLTSAVASVKSGDFTKGSVKSVGQMIQGKVAGLAISNVSGDPNQDVEILLRGQVSLFNGNSSPLIVIDGVPGMSLSMVAPEDVESIDVLKDGSAAAIYGTRANTGVILITTKKGDMSRGKNVKVNIHSYYNYDMVNRRIEMLNAGEYRELIEETREILEDKNLDLATIDKGYDTDWIGELMENQLNHSQHISVQGGNEISSFLGSATYRNLDGIWLNSGKNSLRARLNYSQSALNERFLFDFNVMHEMAEYQKFNQESFRQALYRNPTDRVYNDDGEYVERPEILFYYNPVSMIKERIDEGKSNRSMLSGKASIELLPGFTVGTQLSFQRFSWLEGYASTFKHMDTWYGKDSVRAERDSYLRDTKNMDITGKYKKNISAHSFEALVGYSYFDNSYEGFSAFNTKFATDAFGYNSLELGKGEKLSEKNMDSYKGNNKLIAFFGRLNYSYDGKYLFSASIRREGSTKFGKDNKWGYFPAVSVGWRISNEPFFNLSFINDLKLRGGYGITGAEPYDSYLSKLRFEYQTELYGTGNQFYYNGRYIQGVVASIAPNPDLGWEKKAETNIGIDIVLLNNRISTTVDYFNRKTTGLLWEYSVPVPPNFAETKMANVGIIKNTGLEIELNVIPVKNKYFSWSVSFNFASNNNKILSLSNDLYKMTNDFISLGYPGNPIQRSTHRAMVGERVGIFWGRLVTGLDEEGKWIYKNLNLDSTITGNPKIDDQDEQVIGNGTPKYFAGLTNSIRYKNIDFSFSLRGAFAFQVLNFVRMHFQPLSSLPGNVSVYAKEKPFNDIYVVEAAKYHDYYLEDGDYIKVDNIDLGYTFSIKKAKASVRVYVSANSFFTFTSYTGLDPEVNISGLTPGYDNVGFGGVDDGGGTYPSIKSITGGININF